MAYPVARPIDAVLVCGFHGFDVACNDERPMLGARLVAFDGISIEIGRWTFENVRKAIQARGRPISLSFRNDNLTPEQRTIVARTVANVGVIAPICPKHLIQQRLEPPRVPTDADNLTSSFWNTIPS